MKICLVGSLVAIDKFDEIVKQSKAKPSNAPVNFQMMLAKGLCQNGIIPDVLSFPNFAAYPNSPYKLYKARKEKIFEGLEGFTPRIINFPLIKQLNLYISTYRYLKKWIKENKQDECYVLIYSDYPPYAMAAKRACKNTKAKTVLVMTDFPTFYLQKHKPSLNTWLNLWMDKNRQKNFASYDMYMLLTRHMSQKMQIDDKPQIVIEGFSDFSQYENINVEKYEKKTVMYCGALSDVHNITLLVDAFLKTNIDAELHIYGSGDKEGYIKQAALKDSRIRFMGKVSREELLCAQKQSHLLISVKSKNDMHTNYAFPSKILEYMTSGTATLTTKIGGIPEEYFEQVYTIENEDEISVAKTIEEVLSKDVNELLQKGKQAQEFVVKQKNCFIQAERLLTFLSNNN